MSQMINIYGFLLCHDDVKYVIKYICNFKINL